MENQIFFYLLGFLSSLILIYFFYIFFYRNKRNKETEGGELIALKKDMESIQLSLQNFNLAQDRIENTLIRGGAPQQGQWGEFVLENILESAGLRKGQEYESQKGYKDKEGNLQKPDIIVHMPGKRDIIIDSKVSLNSWHEYSNTKDETLKSAHLKKYLDSVKNFVRELSEDNYSNLPEINTVDSVLMFIPIEPALLTLYKEGVKIIEDAWQKKIIIVGPSTLLYLLKAIENMWRLDKQSKTIKEIASTATEIYDKAVNVYESFILADQSLEKAKIKLDEAKKRLQDGPGSLTNKVEKMKKLGRLSTKKQLPDSDDDVIN